MAGSSSLRGFCIRCAALAFAAAGGLLLDDEAPGTTMLLKSRDGRAVKLKQQKCFESYIKQFSR